MGKTTGYYPNGPYTSWAGGGPGSAFMVPQVEYFNNDEIDEYIANKEWEESSEPGWYARLTAPGYLDCTDWQGPYPNMFRALRDLLRVFEIDLDGNSMTQKSFIKCVLCGRIFDTYKDTMDKWVYHNSVGVVCRRHVGVERWYKEKIKEATLKPNQETSHETHDQEN